MNNKLAHYFYPSATGKYLWVMFHGLGEHAGRYKEFINFLNEQNVDCLICDLPGHGKSTGNRGGIISLDALFKEYERLIPELSSYKKNLLFGHSLGALLALEFQARWQTRCDGFVLSSPALKPIVNKAAYIQKIGFSLGALPVFKHIRQDNSLDTADISSLSTEQLLYKEDPFVHREISFSLFRLLLSLSKKYRNKKVDIPVFSFYGGEDRIVDTRAIAGFIEMNNGFELCLKACRHEVLHDSEESLKEVKKWLKEKVL